MPQSVWCGNPGAGKSYGAVKHLILPILRDPNGRRIVTNLYGLNHERIAKYLNLPLEVVQARLILVTDAQVENLNFWYSPEFPETSTVQPGDFVLIDEARRFFEPGLKISDRCMEFLRMHRHYVHPVSKLCCEIVLISQLLSEDIQRSVLRVSDFTVRMKKLHSLGINRYVVEHYQGSRNPDRAEPFKVEGANLTPPGLPYDPEIYALYESHVGGAGVETKTDTRHTIWDLRFWGIPLYKWYGWPLIVAIFLPWAVWKSVMFFVNPPQIGGLKWSSVSGAVPGAVPPPVGPAGAALVSVPAIAPAAPAAPLSAPGTDDSSEFRLVGIYRFNGFPIAAMEDSTGRIRYVSGDEFSSVFKGPASYIIYRNKRVAYWTGPKREVAAPVQQPGDVPSPASTARSPNAPR